MDPWYENDEFWTIIEPALFDPERLETARGEVEGVLGLLGLQPGARVLDLCCGPGRHAVELARKGFTVVGVDRNPRYLERAGRAAGEAGVEVELVEEDMRSFVRPGAFDAAISLYTSFGYFEDEDENVKVARNVRRSLREGGAALLDVLGKETLALGFEERRWSEHGGAHLLQESRPVDDWSRVESRWVLVRDGRERAFTIRIRLYAATELKALLLGVGFSRVEVYGSVAGAPYDHKAERLVAVARIDS